ncbi:transketolase C-terminal domain-containing protein [Bifidobacterium sp. ESL0732]|uniref:transketolase family protein n=1 Tax=Bifidobacterium sp. ESL0732 TaxID=2983222 RepID=UPI0023F6A8EC|nr:transketolase C-terminal domain-containing protein [Bifidobacterium sp. ESL0732]WEV64313.1 hypothetical protein OZX70_01590 [Bifidobacterium sp. ESL0732]
MTSMRQAWGETLVELGRDNDKLTVVDADLAPSTKATLFESAYPQRFIQAGIAEQNAVGMAAGLASLGFIPWLSSFGVFFTQRSLDQIRMLVSQTHMNVKFGGAYSGLLNGSSGKTHEDVEDIAIMRAMPNMTVLSPADAEETKAAVRWATGYDMPVYLRLSRDDAGDLPEAGNDDGFAIGQPKVLRKASDMASSKTSINSDSTSTYGSVVLISTGAQSIRTLESADLLASAGLQTTVIHLPSIKPLDETAILEAIGDARYVFTVEEHSIYGGIGGLVSEIVAGRPRSAQPGVHGSATADAMAPQVVRIGLNDEWTQCGPNDFLLDRYGLSAQRVAQKVEETVGIA